MSIPLELSLRSTPDGTRMAWQPVKELEALRDGPNQADALASFRAEAVELRAAFEPGDAERIEFTLRGAKVIYDVKKQEIIVNGSRAHAPLVNGKQSLIIFVDKTMLEVFASNGLTYFPMPFIAEPENQEVSVESKGGNAVMNSLQVYKLKSIWEYPNFPNPV